MGNKGTYCLIISSYLNQGKFGGSGLVWAQLPLQPSFNSFPNYGCPPSEWEGACLTWAEV